MKVLENEEKKKETYKKTVETSILRTRSIEVTKDDKSRTE